MPPSRRAAAALADQQHLASVFEERAENLSSDELREWTVFTRKDERTIAKLTGPGAKLLIGPRGSGKSTLLRTAYYRQIRERECLPVYVNYAKSLALEPLFHKTANALQVFRQWVLMKIVKAAADAFREMTLAVPTELVALDRFARELIDRLEVGEAPDELQQPLSPSRLVHLLDAWATQGGLRRCVLLLDDAAHAFSPEQQREFFEVFRELRSRTVAGKAAVYPGVTSYTPNIHVGHEVERVEAWYRPDDDDYLSTMKDIVERRLPEPLKEQLRGKPELIDFIALAAFGLPRGFLNMLSQLLALDENVTGAPTRTRAERAVADHVDSVRRVFGSLSAKLPRFTHLIETGAELDGAIVRTLRKYNRLQNDTANKATVIAVDEPVSGAFERMLNMLEYAGLVRRLPSVSRGVKGRFARYSIHYGLLLAENALSLGKSYKLDRAIQALTSKNAHAFARSKASVLLGKDYESRCTLDLPACPRCGTKRVSEEQRFCMKCGAELKNVSIYEELLQASIDQLPLTKKKLAGIRKHTRLRTVQDILMDDEKQSLLSVPYIGPVWSARIRTSAEEFVSV